MRILVHIACSALALIAGAVHAADPRPVLLTADRVWTGEGAAHQGWAVLVAQGRIQAVGPAASVTARPFSADRRISASSAKGCWPTWSPSRATRPPISQRCARSASS